MAESGSVGVIGAGTMGRGIAVAAAQAGYKVVVYDVSPEALAAAEAQMGAFIRKGVEDSKLSAAAGEQALANLKLTPELATAAKADWIIEAAPEQLELKRSLLAQLDGLAPPETFLATNTSSLSVNVLAAATGRPDRFLGLHFFNPAQIMKLVEIIAGDETGRLAQEAADRFVGRLGKIGVHCKDTPGFIVNRVARPFYGEALRLLGEGAADVETIDRLARSLGFRMGPFELIDLVGCDVNLAVTESVYEAFGQEPRYRPHSIQRRMVASGWLGRKSGRGFYLYPKRS
ncbi:MAG: 3-hydroxyacyl-CoA dehydrogenase family protein [Candidatus Promineifilaceae bacterium]